MLERGYPVMQLHDAVYGSFSLENPFLQELVLSKPVQRMKGVRQAGALYYIDPTRTVTRFEHCVGVMRLLESANASVEEQAAGLLHDVGHTAFSHVIDVVFREFNHNYDDAHLPQIVEKSEIPSICEKHGFEWKRLVEKSHFTLLENNAPRLCADRIDYTLRDAANELEQSTLQKWWKDLIVEKNEFIFSTPEIAKEFAQYYMKLDRDIWSSIDNMGCYEVLADAIKLALKDYFISEDDLYLTDDVLMQKLKGIPSPEIQEKLSWLNHSFSAAMVLDAFDYAPKWKYRWVDPSVRTAEGIVPVSRLFPDLNLQLDMHCTRFPSKLLLRINSKSG